MNSTKGYLKTFLTTAAAGGGFGLVAAFILIQFIEPPLAGPLYFVTTVLAAGTISGLAGLGATALDGVLLKVGIAKESTRITISFSIVAACTFGIFFGALTWLEIIPHYPGAQRYALWGAIAGLAFGASFAVYHYHRDRVRQQMMMLELENRHLADLASREELLREATRNLVVAAERNRMARELHDSISQGIHGIVYSLRSLKAEIKDNPRGQEIHSHLEETAADTLKELRRLVTELNPSPLEDHHLDEAIRLHSDLVSRRQQIGLKLNLDYQGTLQPDQEVALYRITQEALANIQKHAEASEIQVGLVSTKTETTLTIKDNGKGFDQTKKTNGQGLANMAARARQSGGTLIITSQPKDGTMITARYETS